jgi:phosphoserine aminotransferase
MKYFTVGPSQLHPRFREFLDAALAKDIPSLSHRSSAFSNLFAALREDLTQLMRTPGYQTFYTGSATEWMERTVQNMSAEETLHFVGGSFGARHHKIAGSLGRKAVKILQKPDGSYSFEDIPEDAKPELVCLTHNETTNGTMLGDDVIDALRVRFPEALIALDVVSSAPLFDDSFAKADCLFFSVQKVFGLPAGLGVALVNERAVEKSRHVASRQYAGSFHSFEKLAEDAALNRTPETPNVLGMFLLHKVCEDYLARGLDVLKKETEEKGNELSAAIAQARSLEPLPYADRYRSKTVFVARTPGGSKPIIENLKAQGFLIHSGYAADKDTHVRVANFPSTSKQDVQKLTELLRRHA